MKKLLFILALVVAGGVNAQDLSREMTIALKNNDVAALSPLVTDSNKDACLQVGRRQSTILQLAVQMGGPEMITHLIEEKNVDINKACGDFTPLMWAAKNSTPEMVSLLLEAGADKSISINNKTALDFASYYNRTEIIALLND
jgi:ankyrin repeat protein